MSWRRAAVLVALCGPLLVATPAAAGGLVGTERLYVRTIEASAGEVLVPVELSELPLLGPEGDAMKVLGPAGEEVPSVCGPVFARFLGSAEVAPFVWRGGAPDCWREGSFTACRLRLPAGGQRLISVQLDLVRRGRTGYRLYRFDGGQVGSFDPPWQRGKRNGEGIWEPEDATRIDLPQDSSRRLKSDVLRLELYGDGEAPRLLGYRLELAPLYVHFVAKTAGRYRLEYGAGSYSGPNPPYLQNVVPLLQAGPLQERALPPLPARSTAPGLRLGDESFRVAWPVRAAGARPGEVVRLEVPGWVYSDAGEDLEAVRLEAAGSQLPYVLWSGGEPVQAVELHGVQAVGFGVREPPPNIPLPAVALPWTTLFLTAPPMDMQRAVDLGPSWRYGFLPLFQCSSKPPLPCRYEAELRRLSGGDPRLPALTLGGDLPPVDLALWRRRDALVFVWPAEGDVRLLAGGTDLRPPEYDLELLRSQLLARPWKSARLGPREEPDPLRWRRLAAVGLAMLFGLLWLRALVTGASRP